jgi:3-oxoacyl-[acyl-carrier-protein] synthase II
MAQNERSAVCVSAVGAVTPLGESFDDIAEALYASTSGIRKIVKFNVENFKTKWAGVPEYGSSLIRWPRASNSPLTRPGELLYAERAAAHLLREANPLAWYEPNRIGCVLGVDEPALDIQRCVEFLEKPTTRLEDRKTFARQASEYFRLSELLDSDETSALRVVHKLIPFAGYTRCHVGLCSASLQAIGMGLRAIQDHRADAVIVGGVSGKVTPTNVARLEAVGAVCVDPKLTGPQRSRPFDARRSGFVPAEGAVFFLLEREDAVLRRGGNVYGRVLGYGSSMGAQHIVAPHSEEQEMRLSMTRALNDADKTPDEIDCINAHGSSTKLNDAHEARALTALFFGWADPLVTATKSQHGHLIAAAGAMEVLCALISFDKDFVPAILNLENPEPAMGLPLVERSMFRQIQRVLKNSFGMGGLAASIVLENGSAAAS